MHIGEEIPNPYSLGINGLSDAQAEIPKPLVRFNIGNEVDNSLWIRLSVIGMLLGVAVAKPGEELKNGAVWALISGGVAGVIGMKKCL